jgi:hypothetical protein
MFWLNSDVVGLLFGLFMMFVMALIGWITHVPFWTIAWRALSGMVVGYLVGFFASSRIRKAVTTLMVKDRLAKSSRLRERAAPREDALEAPSGEASDEDEFAGLS